MSAQIMIPLQLTPEQAWDLAQFVKRVGWVEYRQNAATDDEAYRIGDAVAALQESLAQAGFAPR